MEQRKLSKAAALFLQSVGDCEVSSPSSHQRLDCYDVIEPSSDFHECQV